MPWGRQARVGRVEPYGWYSSAETSGIPSPPPAMRTGPGELRLGHSNIRECSPTSPERRRGRSIRGAWDMSESWGLVGRQAVLAEPGGLVPSWAWVRTSGTD